MDLAEYQRYADAFNDRRYDEIYDFYAPGVKVAFFGVELNSREAFKKFYSFLHDHCIETLTIHRFASSDELVALEGTIRIEATKDLTAEALEAEGLPTHFAQKKGEVREMPQYIHYHLRDGKITNVGCALM